MAQSYKIGIDVGGTFTDLFMRRADGEVAVFKTLSTPDDPSLGVLDGLSAIAKSQKLDLKTLAAQIESIVHGTTVTTNATLTRRGARTGLLTTEGVRDALEMRRGIREQQYNNLYTNVAPLIPRYLRLGLPGRMDETGVEIEALDPEAIKKAAEHLRDQKVEAVAICFMHSYANPEHEQTAAEIVRRVLPHAFCSVSSDVLPVVRFYNRVSTTALNAYIGPVLGDYLENLTRKLHEIEFGGVLLIMQSNGGVSLPEVTRRWPATTLLSGPAGGPHAAVAYTEAHGRRDCVLVDMGGTSFDASLVRDGIPATTHESDIDRLRIALPMLDITTIGAGGGSIGWIDEGGLLRMGPQSAGAAPGPACYGRGGEQPTCTDADLVLGYLDANFFAGGAMKLDIERAQQAIDRAIARPLEMSIEEAAAGMYRIINANMAHGVREITVKRGLDPREFPMVIAGGAGSLHACMIADELEIPSLIAPPTASVLCATGMLFCDLQHDFVRSHICTFSQIDKHKLVALVDEMRAEGDRQLRSEGIASGQIHHQVLLDLRYRKQYHEVTLTVPLDRVTTGDLASIAHDFHAEHNRLYGYDLAKEGTDLELINVRLRSIGSTTKPSLPEISDASGPVKVAQKGVRRAYVPERNAFAELAVYDGHRLQAGHVIPGPALIEQVNTTLFVSASFSAQVDQLGSFVLTRGHEVNHG